MLYYLLKLALGASPDFGGEFQSHVHFSPQGDLVDLQDSIIFSPRLQFKGNIDLMIDLDLRWSPFLSLDQIEDSQYIEKVQPLSIRTEELWIQTESTHFDTVIGMQNVLWGTGKGVSQINWMAPLDLRNPTKFSEHISVFALKLNAHKDALSSELIVQPWFTPALLPQNDISLFPTAAESFSLDGQTLDVRSQQGNLTVPDPTWKNLQLGTKINLHKSQFDLSIFAFHGRDSLPQANGELLLMGFQTDQDRVDIGVPLIYPEVSTIGSSGSVVLPLDILSWFEVAYVRPEATKLTASLRQMQALESLGTISEVPAPLPSVTTQNGEPYTKWLLGLERYFGNLIISGQWMHGLFIERQNVELSDYALINADWAIRPTLRWNNSVITDGSGLFLQSDLHWLLQDELDLGIGATMIPATQNSKLRSFKSVEQIYGSATYLF